MQVLDYRHFFNSNSPRSEWLTKPLGATSSGHTHYKPPQSLARPTFDQFRWSFAPKKL